MISLRKTVSILAAAVLLFSGCGEIPGGTEAPGQEFTRETAGTETAGKSLEEESGETAESKTWTIETLPMPEAGTAEAEENEDEMLGRLYDSAELGVDSQAYCVLDEDGQVVIGRKELKTYAPASITKVLTALVVVEHADLSAAVTIQESSVTDNLEPMSSGVYPSFKPFETVTVLDLLYALILSSTNSAGNILADHVAGSSEAFAEMMNQKVAELGLSHSHFVNAHGLDAEGHYTCAYDMAVILKCALQNETLRTILSTKSYTIPATEYAAERSCIMGHRMVSGNMPVNGVYAGKPGWTVNAQGTLVTAAERNGRKLYICTMHSDNGNQYEDTENIAEYAYAKLEDRAPSLKALAHNMLIRKTDDTGVDLYYVIDNGGQSTRIVYWDLTKGTGAAVFGTPAEAKPRMGVHLSLPYHGAYMVQIFVTQASGEETGIGFHVLYTGEMLKSGLTDWNGQTYVIDDFGLLKCGGGVEVPEGIFYTNEDGAIAHGFCGRFYAGEDGRLVTGWVTAEGVTCYCQGDGRLATGRMVIGGAVHQFNAYGALIQ